MDLRRQPVRRSSLSNRFFQVVGSATSTDLVRTMTGPDVRQNRIRETLLVSDMNFYSVPGIDS